MDLLTKFDHFVSTLVREHLKSISIQQVKVENENIDGMLLQFIYENWDNLKCDQTSLLDFHTGLIKLHYRKQDIITPENNTESLCVRKSFDSEEGDVFVPLVYDMLMRLFKHTDVKERETYFHLILNHYYKKLSIGISPVIVWNFHEILPEHKFIRDVNLFLPYVKFDILKSAVEENNDNMTKHMVQEVCECITYPKFPREYCYLIVNKISIDVPYDFVKFKLLPVVDSSGSLGEYYTLKLSVRNTDMIKTLNLFVKYLPTNNPISNEDQRELARKSFKKEEFFYNIFISTLNKLGFEHITNFAPKLYLVIKDEALVFEDLSEIGYRISDIRQTANIEWLYSCIKSLAKLHACSILFEEKMSSLKEKMYRIDEEYEENLVETLMIKDSLLYGNSGRTVVNGIIDKFPDVPKRFSVEEFKRKAKQKFDLECEMVTKSTKYRNVICHGDLWASNIMIKEDPHTLTTSNFLIDFQLIKYCPPAFDLLQVIYTHTSKEMRADYLNYLLRVYYENLTENLRRYGVDVTEILDKKAFMSCCKDMKSAAICSALNFVQVFVPEDRYTYLKSTDQEKKTEFLVGDRIKFLEEVLQEEPLKTRIRDLLVDLYNECLDEDQ